MLALAILPLGVLSIIQARNAQEELRVSTLEAVVGASLQAAKGQIELIREAQIAARTFAASLPISLSEGGVCQERAEAVAGTIPAATLVSYVPMSGMLTCSSNGRSHDYSGDPLFEEMIEEPLPSAIYNPRGPISGIAVVVLGHPVFDTSGKQVGIVTIALPYHALTPGDFDEGVGNWRPSYLATVAPNGTILASSDPQRDLSSILPADISVPDLSDRVGLASFETSSGGQQILSVTSVAKDLLLVSVWKHQGASLLDPDSVIAPYLLPALTWVAAFIAAAFASNGLVARHVQTLSRSMTDYMKTKARVTVPDMTDAPPEIQRLHDVYQSLINTIAQDEAEMQNLLVDKDTLLREVNHRSGNSLQIIASVMRMYRRETTDPAQLAVLDGLISRTLALSSTHTSLYTLAGQRDVPLDKVLFDVVGRLKQIHRIGTGTVEKHLDPIRTDAQTAAGVALAAAEAVNCFFTLSRPSNGQVKMYLRREGDEVRLTISGPSVPEYQADGAQGIRSLPRRMLQQFAAQLRGTLAITDQGGVARVDLVFPANATLASATIAA